jgi:eukaryotic-like serine/threonine-protein kinase
MPPQGPRSRPPAPLPEPEYEPEPEPKKNRGLAIAASILAVLLVAGIAYAIIDANRGDNSAAGPTTSASNTPSQPPSNPPSSATAKPTTTKPTPTTEPSKPTSKPPASKFSKAQVAQAVQQHYAKLPKNVEDALADWDPQEAPSLSSEKEYWGQYTKVAIKGTPLVTASDDGTFEVTSALALTEAESDKTVTEEHTLKISGKGEKLLIINEKRN